MVIPAVRARLGWSQASKTHAHATKGKHGKHAKTHHKQSKDSNHAMDDLTAKIDDVKAKLEELYQQGSEQVTAMVGDHPAKKAKNLYRQGAAKVSDMMGSSDEGHSKGRKNKSSSHQGESNMEAAKSTISNMYQQGAEKVSAMVGDYPADKARDLYHQGAAKMYEMMGDKENKQNHENQAKNHVEGKDHGKSSSSHNDTHSKIASSGPMMKGKNAGHNRGEASPDKENVNYGSNKFAVLADE
jgi:hypothetical protein